MTCPIVFLLKGRTPDRVSSSFSKHSLNWWTHELSWCSLQRNSMGSTMKNFGVSLKWIVQSIRSGSVRARELFRSYYFVMSCFMWEVSQALLLPNGWWRMSKDTHSHLCQGFCDLQTLYVNGYYVPGIFRLPLHFLKNI